ncbi:uncharacterized protein [Triticum aestivum]|uniref:uncharacterized protein n=1 Tax=Triticum aestivum TaxID=4565 RepID=UPI001D03337D|nr:uncharacterized protein LOC123164204 [Triticum aestivum]
MSASVSSVYGSVLTGFTMFKAIDSYYEDSDDSLSSESSVNQFSSMQSELSDGSFQGLTAFELESDSDSGDAHDVAAGREEDAIEPEAGGNEGSGEHDPTGVAWIGVPDPVGVDDGDESQALAWVSARTTTRRRKK